MTKVKGHILRRIVHGISILTPILYFWFGNQIASLFFMNRMQLVSVCVGVVCLGEAFRKSFRLKVYGERTYERHYISGAVWLVFSSGLVLLLTPHVGFNGAGIAAPIIWAACCCDIIMGELRICGYSIHTVFLTGLVVSAMVWICCALFLGSPWLVLPFLIPMVVIAEIIDQPGLDDNFTMLFFPLAFVIFIKPWAL